MTYLRLASVHRKIYKGNEGEIWEMFKNKRFITKGVSSQVGLLLQLFMWQCIDEMKVPKDYLQVFELTLEDGKQKIVHIQEFFDKPEYKREYLLKLADTPIFIGKIFVIDDGEHSTMMLASEY